MSMSSGGAGPDESSGGLQSVAWACRDAEDRVGADDRGLAAIMAALSASDKMARPSEEIAFQVGSGNVALGLRVAACTSYVSMS